MGKLLVSQTVINNGLVPAFVSMFSIDKRILVASCSRQGFQAGFLRGVTPSSYVHPEHRRGNNSRAGTSYQQ
jgi:hypothetical protein